MSGPGWFLFVSSDGLFVTSKTEKATSLNSDIHTETGDFEFPGLCLLFGGFYSLRAVAELLRWKSLKSVGRFNIFKKFIEEIKWIKEIWMRNVFGVVHFFGDLNSLKRYCLVTSVYANQPSNWVNCLFVYFWYCRRYCRSSIFIIAIEFQRLTWNFESSTCWI